MNVFKQFNQDDLLISPITLTKSFELQGASELSYLDILTDTSIPGNRMFDSIKHLYYSNYISGSNGQISKATQPQYNSDGTVEGPFYQTNRYNYEMTTLNPHKYFSDFKDIRIGVISIPQSIFGDNIEPHSVLLMDNSEKVIVVDDGNGVLYQKGNNNNIVGNIIYPHGMLILYKYIIDDTNTLIKDKFTSINLPNNYTNLISTASKKFQFKSNYTTYKTQYRCVISPNEFNFSSNPTITKDEVNLKEEFKETYFSPYITTIGLYNKNNELVLIGKLSEPLPKSQHNDTTILINLDR